MPVLCDMVLDNPQLIYQPGDVLSGYITLTLDERTLIKGYASTCWEAPSKGKKQNKNKTTEQEVQKPKEVYSNREDYIATSHYFVGSDAAMAKIVEVGSYTYHFSVHLPGNCPSVFESAIGHIRYELDVFMNYPDYRQTCYFRNIHVSRPVDLQNIAGINQEREIETVEKKPFLKFWQRRLQLLLNLPKSGYVPGDNISLYIKVLNYDLMTLTHVTYKLNLVASYTGFWKKKVKTNFLRTNLVTTLHSLFGQNGSVVQHLQNITVPETPPTLTIGECRCIQLSYEVEVVVETTCKNRRISAILPLTIGTTSSGSNLRSMPSEITGSAPVLAVKHSEKDIQEAKNEEGDVFETATAPVPETLTAMAPLNHSLSFREADFMPSATLNKKKKFSKSMETLEDFKPKYVYYDNTAPGVTNADILPENPTTSSVLCNNNEKTRI